MLDEAVTSFQEAIVLMPDFAEAHLYLGSAFKKRGELERDLTSYRQALSINPNLVEAYNNLGNVFKHRGELTEAVANYRQALSIKPEYADAHSNLLLSLNFEVDVSQTEIVAEARDWNKRHASMFPKPVGYDNDRSPDRRLRVGYVSPDMRMHSVSYFFEPLLAAHDSSAVETYCYAGVAIADSTTRRLEGYADHWRRTFGMADEALSDMIRADGIDILVDLTGHTGKNRLLVFARQPSPVQVSWLGYPNTTGLAAMEYRLVDAVTDPTTDLPGETTETLIRLPNGFMYYRSADAAPALVLERSPGPVNFGSFNNASKMSGACIDLWSRVLTEVPDSKLLLKSRPFTDVPTRDLVRTRFSRRGITPDRLELLAYSDSLESHLGLYGGVDVCLDPFPYNGTTTTCEALWMGVPVVTLCGDSHRGRVGASILSRIGLDDCVAADADAYVSIAANLARDTSRRMELRRNMRKWMAPLCDADSFARDMEAAYRSMWQDWCMAHS